MPVVHSLLNDGVIAGIGGVLSFVPLIAIMFLFIAFLEDWGYVARVAFILDKILKTFGLQGKSILAMLLAGLGGDVSWFGEYGVVSVVEGFVGRNARAVAISAILMVVCIVGVCLTVCVVSDSVLHRKIKQEYEIKPRRYSSAGDKDSVREENED